jgi:hypothetical protein
MAGLRIKVHKLPLDQTFCVFEPQPNDSIVTLGFRNRSERRTEVRYQVAEANQKHIIDEESETLMVYAFDEKRKENINVPKGCKLLVKTIIREMEAYAYLGQFTAQPGAFNLQQDVVQDITVTFPGFKGKQYSIRTEIVGDGINLEPATQLIDGSAPVHFSVSRKKGSSPAGMIRFYIDELKLRTTIDFSCIQYDVVNGKEISLLSAYTYARNMAAGV